MSEYFITITVEKANLVTRLSGENDIVLVGTVNGHSDGIGNIFTTPNDEFTIRLKDHNASGASDELIKQRPVNTPQGPKGIWGVIIHTPTNFDIHKASIATAKSVEVRLDFDDIANIFNVKRTKLMNAEFNWSFI